MALHEDDLQGSNHGDDDPVPLEPPAAEAENEPAPVEHLTVQADVHVPHQNVPNLDVESDSG